MKPENGAFISAGKPDFKCKVMFLKTNLFWHGTCLALGVDTQTINQEQQDEISQCHHQAF
jgi:hypothetical protein